MHLSRLLLNPRSRQVGSDIHNVHALHRRVLSAFPDEHLAAARRHYGVLFRQEFDRQGSPLLLVQSEAEPDWSALPKNYVADSFEPNPATKRVDEVLERIRAGSRWRFRLRANPTKRLHAGAQAPGRRVGVRGDAQLLQWLERRGAAAGFAPAAQGWFESARVTEKGRLFGSRQRARLTFDSALFEGILQVTERELFLGALKGGLGAAKGYGFGLLSLAPARV